MFTFIAYLTIATLAGLLIGTIVIDRRIQSDLEADVARERKRANTLAANVDAGDRKIARLRVKLRRAKAARRPVPTDDAELDRLLDESPEAHDDVTDAELELAALVGPGEFLSCNPDTSEAIVTSALVPFSSQCRIGRFAAMDLHMW